MASIPAWFDYDLYMNNKLAQMQKVEPNGDWTMDKLVDAFAQNGFVSEGGAYNHFVEYGAKEEVSPNAYFNAEEYYAAKAAEFYKVAPDALTELQIANVKVLIHEAGMNAWTHYVKYGSNEGVNPSNSFDASDYLAAKAAVMGGDWTAESVGKAIADAGMTVLEHYLTYAGKSADEVPADATFPVPAEEQVPSDNPGETFTLTAGRDIVPGTSGNDIINGYLGINPSTGQADVLTFNTTDEIDGGDGKDTLNIELKGANVADKAASASVKNVENVNFTIDDAATADISAWTGVENLTVNQLGTAAAQDWTVEGAKTASFKGGSTVKVTDKAADGKDTLATVSAEGATDLVTVASDALTTLNLKDVAAGATVTDATATDDRALTVNMNDVKGTLTDANATAVTLNTTGKASTMTLTAARAKALTINADEALTLNALAGSTVLKTITVTGDSLVTFTDHTAASGLESVDASASTGGVVLTKALDNGTTFIGGAGKDSVEVGKYAKTLDMGAGNDTVTLASAALADTAVVKLGAGDDTLFVNVKQTSTKAVVDGGDGIDTIAFTDATYGNKAEMAIFKNFETLSVSSSDTTQATEFDVSVLSGIQNYEVGTSTGSVTLINILNNASTTVTGNISDEKSLKLSLAVDTQNDTHTIKMDNGVAADETAKAGIEVGGTNGGGLEVSQIEHLKIESNGNANTANTIASLKADTYLADVTISGDQDFSLTLKGEYKSGLTLDGSQADGKLTLDASGVTSLVNIKGGSADDVINGGTKGGTITGGAGDDVITLGKTPGVKDVIVYTQASDSQALTGAVTTNGDSITNFAHGDDKIDLSALNIAKQGVVIAETPNLEAADLFANAGLIFDKITNKLYVDANNDGVYNADQDMAITLTGVTEFDANDVVFHA